MWTSPRSSRASSPGAVGIAGIAGTAWQGKRGREAAARDLKENLEAANENLRRGIDADNKRSRLATKRQIYASYLTAYNRAHTASSLAVKFEEDDFALSEKALSLLIEARDGQTALFNATQELLLIAPDRIASFATELNRRVLAMEADSGPDPEAIAMQRRMVTMMRVDLGELPFDRSRDVVTPEASVNTSPTPESSLSPTGFPDSPRST